LSDTAEAGTGGPGSTLARLRDERKLSIADVAQRLKYGARQIEALEAEEFDRLPGATFVRGMVRGYAKLLETDPEPILAALEQRYVPGEISLDLRAKRVPFPQGGKRRGNRTYLFLSIFVFIVVAGVLYEWRMGTLPLAKLASTTPPEQKQAKPRPDPAPAPAEAELPAAPPVVAAEKPAVAATTSAPTPPLPGVPAATGGEGRVRMEFAGESWVEIKDGDGKMLMSQLNPTGSRRVVAGKVPLLLVIGNAANVRVTYNDKPIDLKPYIQIEVARLTLD
jgi:cytoskeleton protein RodZ